MKKENLIRLEKIGHLKAEHFDQQEYNGLIKSAAARLKDSTNISLSDESRFDLAYNAAHSLALAALRKHGYRSINRYTVFQVLPCTLGIADEDWRILDKCHNQRNVAEYEGYFEVDGKLLKELLRVAQLMLGKVE